MSLSDALSATMSAPRRLLRAAMPVTPPPPNLRSSPLLAPAWRRGMMRASFFPRFPLLVLAAALVALAVFFTAGAPPAAAGTEGTLVSNTGQQLHTDVDFNNRVHAQAFTTGPYVDGYHLTGIEAVIGTGAGLTSEDAATVRAEVWSDSNGTPGTRVVI